MREDLRKTLQECQVLETQAKPSGWLMVTLSQIWDLWKWLEKVSYEDQREWAARNVIKNWDMAGQPDLSKLRWETDDLRAWAQKMTDELRALKKKGEPRDLYQTDFIKIEDLAVNLANLVEEKDVQNIWIKATRKKKVSSSDPVKMLAAVGFAEEWAQELVKSEKASDLMAQLVRRDRSAEESLRIFKEVARMLNEKGREGWRAMEQASQAPKEAVIDLSQRLGREDRAEVAWIHLRGRMGQAQQRQNELRFASPRVLRKAREELPEKMGGLGLKERLISLGKEEAVEEIISKQEREKARDLSATLKEEALRLEAFTRKVRAAQEMLRGLGAWESETGALGEMAREASRLSKRFEAQASQEKEIQEQAEVDAMISIARRAEWMISKDLDGKSAMEKVGEAKSELLRRGLSSAGWKALAGSPRLRQTAREALEISAQKVWVEPEKGALSEIERVWLGEEALCAAKAMMRVISETQARGLGEEAALRLCELAASSEMFKRSAIGQALIKVEQPDEKMMEKGEAIAEWMRQASGELIAGSWRIMEKELKAGRGVSAALEKAKAFWRECEDLATDEQEWWKRVNPKDPIAGLRREHEQWVERLRLESLGPKKEWQGLTEKVETVDGFEFEEIKDSHALHEEGAAMSHCVGSYGHYCEQGSKRIFSVRKEGRRVSTLELNREEAEWKRGDPVWGHMDLFDAKRMKRISWKAGQNYGLFNQRPSEECLRASRKFVESLNASWIQKAQEKEDQEIKAEQKETRSKKAVADKLKARREASAPSVKRAAGQSGRKA